MFTKLSKWGKAVFTFITQPHVKATGYFVVQSRSTLYKVNLLYSFIKLTDRLRLNTALTFPASPMIQVPVFIGRDLCMHSQTFFLVLIERLELFSGVLIAVCFSAGEKMYPFFCSGASYHRKKYWETS